MLIVAGGKDSSGNRLASSEVYQFPAGDVWKYTSDLPSPRTSLRGVSLANTVYFSGGYDDNSGELDDVLVYDISRDTFSLAGDLTTARYNHAVTEVPWQAVAQYCSTTATPQPTDATL